MAQDCIIALDIGTTATKALCVTKQGGVQHTLRLEGEQAPTGSSLFATAVRALRQCQPTDSLRPVALALTSQVGSYLPFAHNQPPEALKLHSWQSASGTDYAAPLCKQHNRDYWLQTIGMQHPPLGSYPGPFLLKLQGEAPQLIGQLDKLLSIKDYIYYRFTGLFASDPYTWRGLYNLTHNTWPTPYLAELGIAPHQLPEIHTPWSAPAKLSRELAAETGLPEGLPVVVGCNDFYAALIGCGNSAEHWAFDITGTSEHIGVISPSCPEIPELISGPYLTGYAAYGVTAASGTALQWASSQLPGGFPHTLPPMDLPIFLPYLKGERSPYYSAKASGIFWGLTPHHTAKEMFLGVADGVVCSLYHIWSLLPQTAREGIDCIHATGGATKLPLVNQIKADLFGLPVQLSSQSESSALGAAALAARYLGWFAAEEQGPQHWNPPGRLFTPRSQMTTYYRERYQRFLEMSSCASSLF